MQVAERPTKQLQMRVTILKGQDANLDQSMVIAQRMGGRLLETRDFESLSGSQVGELKEAVKANGWTWLGDKRGLLEPQATELKKRLEGIFGEEMNVYTGSGPLAFGGIGTWRLYVGSYEWGDFGARVVAVVGLDEAKPENALRK